MLGKYLIIAAVTFASGFGVGSYWQSTLRALDTATRDAADASATVAAHEQGAQLAGTINAIETTALQETQHAADDNLHLSLGLADGTIRLQLAGACPTAVPDLAAGIALAAGAGAGLAAAPGQDRPAGNAARLNRDAEPHYLALRSGIQRCRAKVTALQAIVKEERRVGNVE